MYLTVIAGCFVYVVVMSVALLCWGIQAGWRALFPREPAAVEVYPWQVVTRIEGRYWPRLG